MGREAKDMAEEDLKKKRVLLIGGSAGSLDVILKIVGALPVPLSLPVVIVVHRKSGAESILADLLGAKTGLAVKEVEDKDAVEDGVIYLAPPDYHLLFEKDGNFSLDSSEKVQYSRPSIDVSFESAADVYGSRVIAVLLSGANADGAEGLHRIFQTGGYTLVEAPHTAGVSYMPQQALNRNGHHEVVPTDDLATRLSAILKQLV